MSKNILLPLIVIILLGSAFFAFGRQTAANLPFTPCEENCEPSKALKSAALLTTSRGVDFFAMELRADVELPAQLKINVFADYDFSGRYDDANGEEWIVRNAEVASTPGGIAVFPLPTPTVKGALPLTVVMSAEDLGNDETEPVPSTVSVMDFLFETAEVRPVSGVFAVFDAIEREQAQMVQSAVPSTCIGPDGNQIPCTEEAEEAPPSELELFYFFQPDNADLLGKIFGTSETTPATPVTSEFNFFSDGQDNVERLLKLYWEEQQKAGTMNEYYWSVFSGVPIEAPEVAPSVTDYLNEAIVIS